MVAPCWGFAYPSLSARDPQSHHFSFSPIRNLQLRLGQLLVTVIIALLASIAIPQFDGIRQRAYNTAVLADLNNANKEIERFFNEHYRYPADDGELIAEGYSHSPGVAFTTFNIRDAGNPQTTRVHMHIDHEASRQYYPTNIPRAMRECPNSLEVVSLPDQFGSRDTSSTIHSVSAVNCSWQRTSFLVRSLPS